MSVHKTFGQAITRAQEHLRRRWPNTESINIVRDEDRNQTRVFTTNYKWATYVVAAHKVN